MLPGDTQSLRSEDELRIGKQQSEQGNAISSSLELAQVLGWRSVLLSLEISTTFKVCGVGFVYFIESKVSIPRSLEDSRAGASEYRSKPID